MPASGNYQKVRAAAIFAIGAATHFAAVDLLGLSLVLFCEPALFSEGRAIG
ncbi:hypothetical protein [Phyllobacterium sp. K27]